MTVLFVLLPVLALGLSFVRPGLAGLYCGNMLVLTGLASINLVHTVWYGAVKSTFLIDSFLMVETCSAGLGVYLDFYSSYAVWVVFLISFLVHLYSTSYMGADPRLGLFLSYLTLFTFFMVVLLVSPNYLQLFMGWEGVGLTSYLLVNFWHTRTQANKSSLKALIVNRVGDFFFLYGLFLVVGQPTLSFVDLGVNHHPGLSFFVVAAAAAKSAQLGLHTWLPDAMEGPTPVSALIHAATMVTAGIFLLFRSTHLVQDLLPWLTHLGGLTALFAGTVALFQFDLKRVIAYSTCAQLGYMVVAYSLDFPELSVYHLANHAFFKALLFLLAGLVIHACLDEQDMRRHGGLLRVLPVTYSLFVVGNLALGGFPFLSGFYSKDLILESLYGGGHLFGYLTCLAAAYLTAAYSFRAVALVFFGLPRGPRSTRLLIHEGDWTSLGVVLVLAVATLFHGWFTRDVAVGPGMVTGWSSPWIQAEFDVPTWVKLLPLELSLAAAYVVTTPLHRFGPSSWVTFFSHRWLWDALDSSVARRGLVKCYYLYTDLERGLFEVVGPTGVNRLLARGYDLFRFRGWFTLLWVAILLGFAFLAISSGLTAKETSSFLPYLPFAVVVGEPSRIEDEC